MHEPKFFPLRKSSQDSVPKNFPAWDWAKNFSLAGLAENFRYGDWGRVFWREVNGMIPILATMMERWNRSFFQLPNSNFQLTIIKSPLPTDRQVPPPFLKGGIIFSLRTALCPLRYVPLGCRSGFQQMDRQPLCTTHSSEISNHAAVI